MMKRFKILGISLVLFVFQANSQGISHDIFDGLLKKHVSAKGEVNYGGFAKDRAELNKYIELISKSAPKPAWTTNQKLAYWINAYNAYTIVLILNHADKKIKSIKDIGDKIKIPFVNTPWDVKFIEIEGKSYDLNAIEHGIIRKQFSEPRIHFALVCAAKSCPPLRNEAFNAINLNAQLDQQAGAFINDTSKNVIKTNAVSLSKIFDWYRGDFKTDNMINYLNKYANIKAENNAKISYSKYDWALNGKL